MRWYQFAPFESFEPFEPPETGRLCILAASCCLAASFQHVGLQDCQHYLTLPLLPSTCEFRPHTQTHTDTHHALAAAAEACSAPALPEHQPAECMKVSKRKIQEWDEGFAGLLLHLHLRQCLTLRALGAGTNGIPRAYPTPPAIGRHAGSCKNEDLQP